MDLNFENTATAFKRYSLRDLKRIKLLLKALNYPALMWLGRTSSKIVLHIPFLRNLIHKTIFKQFIGGQNLEEALSVVNQLFFKYKVGSILDYAIEGKKSEDSFDSACKQIIESIKTTHLNEAIPFAVFKITAVGSSELLEKTQSKKALSSSEKKQHEAMLDRINEICRTSYSLQVPLFIDAEESWIQTSIDHIVVDQMKKFNKEKVIIYNTLQCYLKDADKKLQELHEESINAKYLLGVKIVRGAYIEQESNRANELNINNPIHPSKKLSDECFDDAVAYCVKHISQISICVATHNEKSVQKLSDLLLKNQLDNNDPRVFSAQLYGMGDHITFNLIKHNHNVVKYMPYGPIKEVIPYLLRRAHENKSMQGQTNRELLLINKELKRRKENQ